MINSIANFFRRPIFPWSPEMPGSHTNLLEQDSNLGLGFGVWGFRV